MKRSRKKYKDNVRGWIRAERFNITDETSLASKEYIVFVDWLKNFFTTNYTDDQWDQALEWACDDAYYDNDNTFTDTFITSLHHFFNNNDYNDKRNLLRQMNKWLLHAEIVL